MEVILADDYGFCYGVKRAIKTAKDNIDLSKKVCTLGPIIHNPQMVKSLADEGIGIVESVDEMENGKIIIRSHGVGPSIYDAIKAKGLELADATCPHVKKAQMSAKTLADEGFKVIIIGDKNLADVKSIIECAGKNSLVIGSQKEAENIIANWIKQENKQNKDYHVLYRVTPIYKGENKLATGVQLEAKSVEEEGVSFNKFIYNVQDNFEIDYSTGKAKLIE